MSHKMLRPFIVKVSVLGHFPLLLLYISPITLPGRACSVVHNILLSSFSIIHPIYVIYR